MRQPGQGRSFQLRRRAAEHLLKGRISLGQMPIPIHTDNADGGGIEDGLKLLFAFPQRLFGLAACGNVLHRAFVVQQDAAGRANSPHVLRDPEQRAVPPPDLGLEIGHRFRKLHPALELGAALRVYIEVAPGVDLPGDQRIRGVIAVNPGQRGVRPQVMAVGRSLENADQRLLK